MARLRKYATIVSSDIAVAGLRLFSGKVRARTIGIILAMVSAVVNAGFLSAYPTWSTSVIAFDVAV